MASLPQWLTVQIPILKIQILIQTLPVQLTVQIPILKIQIQIQQAYQQKQGWHIKRDWAKLKKTGIEPTQRAQLVEQCNDDCGDDITGLGKYIKAMTTDNYEETESSADENFLTIPLTIPNHQNEFTNVYNFWSSLCFRGRFCVLGGLCRVWFDLVQAFSVVVCV